MRENEVEVEEGEGWLDQRDKELGGVEQGKKVREAGGNGQGREWSRRGEMDTSGMEQCEAGRPSRWNSEKEHGLTAWNGTELSEMRQKEDQV